MKRYIPYIGSLVLSFLSLLSMGFFENIAIGGTAGVLSRTLTAPIDLYKLQLQNPYMPAKSLYDVVRMEGFRHLWKGNLSNSFRVFPQQAINYPVYQWAHTQLPDTNSTTVNTFISGLLGGSLATLITYPLETMRSRFGLQVNHSHYRGIWHAYKTTPFRQWYQGIGINMVGFPIFNALCFTWFRVLPPLNHELDHVVRGGTAGILAVIVTYPGDLLRRRMQMQGFDPAVPVYSSTKDAIRHILHTQGYRGLYRGFGACSLKIFPALGIQFYCYRWLHTFMNTHTDN